MRHELITAIQRSIIMYVMQKESNAYRGNGSYDLQYIRDSQYIPDHRKQNIRELDDICNQSNRNNSTKLELARSIYNYLQNIKTGWLLFWFIQVGNSSIMRDNIHQAIFIHDPKLFSDCKIPPTNSPSNNQSDNNAGDVRINITESPMSDTENITSQYTRFAQTISDLKSQIDSVTRELREEKIKNAALSDSLSKQNFCNDALKRKITFILQNNKTSSNSRSEIQLAATPKKAHVQDNNIVPEVTGYRL